jgi:hypothetical protein
MKSTSAIMKDILDHSEKRGLKAAAEKVLNSGEVELKVNDLFIAPIFQDEACRGTGAFMLVELFDTLGSDELFGAVRVIGALCSKLMRALEDRFEEANDLVHFCRNSKCPFEEPGLGITHLLAYEHISSTELDRLTEGDLFKVNHHLWDKRRSIAEASGAGSSRDLRGSNATRGRPVSRGPAVSELSASGGPKTSLSTTDGSNLERLEDLRLRRKDSRMNSPRGRSQALRDHYPREDDEPAISPSSGSNRMRNNDPSPMSARMVSRANTPSGRSVKDSQPMEERAVNKELVRPTDLPDTRRHVMGGSPCSRARSHGRHWSPSLNSRDSGSSSASYHEAPSSGSSARLFGLGLADGRLAEGFSIIADLGRSSFC